MLAVWPTKTSLTKGTGSAAMRELTYVIYKPRSEINLDLFEAERYEAAIVVQPLIGNLVYYSNYGRYEPRIAARWERENAKTWSFYLRDGLSCENGEIITAKSFKESLERSILAVSHKGEPPIFNRLKGYQSFLESKGELEGLTAEGNKLSFTFDRPIRSGLVEVLSFAPFGFICKDNLNPDGTWKDKTRFISSGPYKVSSIKIGKEYVLESREEWKHLANPNSPDKVRVVHEIPENATEQDPLIIDCLFPVENKPSFMKQFSLVPEYLNAILLGNLEKGVFSDLHSRRLFRAEVEKFRDEMPSQFGIYSRANAFFSGGRPMKSSDELRSAKKTWRPPTQELVIEGKEPTEHTFKYESWLVLKKALESLDIKYRFADNDAIWKDVRSGAFDLRLRGTSIGGGVEAWSLDVLFCSLIGPNYPDPTGQICDLIGKYENDQLDDRGLEKTFLEIIDQDAAVVPISHFGIQLYLSPAINRESLNPTLNVMRFDQLVINSKL